MEDEPREFLGGPKEFSEDAIPVRLSVSLDQYREIESWGPILGRNLLLAWSSFLGRPEGAAQVCFDANAPEIIIVHLEPDLWEAFRKIGGGTVEDHLTTAVAWWLALPPLWRQMILERVELDGEAE